MYLPTCRIAARLQLAPDWAQTLNVRLRRCQRLVIKARASTAKINHHSCQSPEGELCYVLLQAIVVRSDDNSHSMAWMSRWSQGKAVDGDGVWRRD